MTDPSTLYSQLTNAFNHRHWRQAQQLAGQLLSIAPRHAGTYYVSGIAHMELQEMPVALEHLRRAGVLQPTQPEFVVQYAKALTIARRHRDAKVVADQAMALAPSDPMLLDTLGVVYTQVGDYASAVTVFGGAATLAPMHAPYRYNLATSLIAAGEFKAAEGELDTCLTLDPKYWRAHLTLSQLRRQTRESNHVERLQSLLPEIDDSDTEAQVWVNMALAKEYEDIEDYSTAFKYLKRGKSAGGGARSYAIEQDEQLFATIMQNLSEPVSATVGCQSAEPIFIVGMPRTGTTLVERIISSHPDVHSAGELLKFGMSLKFLSGSQTEPLIDAETIIAARGIDWNVLGETYLASTRPGTAQKPRFIDKLPHNFLYAGYIANALPNARIVCLRRDPMDTCLSNFRQLFAPKSAYFDYSFDILDTGRYYVLFDRLMAHWQRAFPGRILEVQYESLVDEQEARSRELLQFCGLSWDETCLRFENNPAPVATASAVQVRTPIYRTALRRWKKYGAELNELQKLLTDAGIAIEQ